MSRYKMIAREDFEAHAKDVVAALIKERDKMYHALDILPVTDFDLRDGLNTEIATNIGEQRAWRKMCQWVAENYPSESMSLEGLMDLQNRVEGKVCWEAHLNQKSGWRARSSNSTSCATMLRCGWNKRSMRLQTRS